MVVTNGDAAAPGPVRMLSSAEWLARATFKLAPADTHRDDMAFWMYSSGSTGRPKGIVHLQHDMLYTHLSYARNLLKLTEEDVCFSVPKIFFAYGFGNSITFPFAAGASSVLLPRTAQAHSNLRDHSALPPDGVLRIADALHGVEQGSGGKVGRSVKSAAVRLGGRDTCSRSPQCLERHLWARSRGRLGVKRGSAHLPVQHGRGQKARLRRQTRAGV